MNNNQNIKPYFGTARVVFSFPDTGWYMVQPFDSDENQLYPATDIQNTTMSSVGLTGSFTYTPNTNVTYIRLEDTSIDHQAIGMSNYDFLIILGTDKSIPLLNTSIFEASNTDPQSEHDALNSEFHSMIKDLYGKINQNKGYGTPLDVQAGDICLRGGLGSLFYMNLFETVLSASANNKILLDYIDNSLNTLTEESRHETVSQYNNTYKSLKGHTIIQRLAKTYSEGLGVYPGSKTEAFTINEEAKGDDFIYTPKEDQQGIFREMEIKGDICKGSLNITAIPEEGSGVRTGEGDAPIIAQATHTTFDGSHSIKAFKHLLISKDPYIDLPREIKEEIIEELEESEPKDDFLTTVCSSIPENERSDYAELILATKEKYKKERYLKHMVTNVKNWKFREDIPEDTDKLKDLPEDAVGYDITTDKEITIKHTIKEEEEIKLRALLSALEFGEDGSIILKASKGEALKMSRGNITLTCPGDIFEEPGRDLIKTIPRTLSITAGKTLEIGSLTEDVKIKADRNVSMLSGNSGTGYTIIENRGEQPLTVKDIDYEKNEYTGSGVVIKSTQDVSMTGSNMRLGLTPAVDTKGGLSDEGKTGSLLIDTGLGVLSFKSNMLVGDFKQGISLSSTSDTGGSLLHLSQVGMHITAPTTTIGTKQFKVGKTEEKTIQAIDTDCIFSVLGGLQIQNNIQVGENLLVTDTILAEAVHANTGSFKSASDLSGLKNEDGITLDELDIDSIDNKGTADFTESVNKQMKRLTTDQGLFTDIGVKNIGFAYFNSDLYNTEKLYKVQHGWQRDSTLSNTWKKIPVLDPIKKTETLSYPGKKSWTKADLIRTLLDEGKDTMSISNVGGMDTYLVNVKL